MVVNAKASLNTTLQGRPLAFAEATWILVAVLTLAAFVATVPDRYQQLLDADLTTKYALWDLGLSVSFYAAYFVAAEVASMLVYALTAAIIFWRKSDDWMAVFVALTLLTFGAAAPSPMHLLVTTQPAGGWLGAAVAGRRLGVFPHLLLSVSGWALRPRLDARIGCPRRRVGAGLALLPIHQSLRLAVPAPVSGVRRLVRNRPVCSNLPLPAHLHTGAAPADQVGGGRPDYRSPGRLRDARAEVHLPRPRPARPPKCDLLVRPPALLHGLPDAGACHHRHLDDALSPVERGPDPQAHDGLWRADGDCRRHLRPHRGAAGRAFPGPGQPAPLHRRHWPERRAVPAFAPPPASRRQPVNVRRERRSGGGVGAPRPAAGRGARARGRAADDRGDGGPGAESTLCGDGVEGGGSVQNRSGLTPGLARGRAFWPSHRRGRRRGRGWRRRGGRFFSPLPVRQKTEST